MRRRDPRKHGIAIATAIVLVASPLAGLLHYAVVPHAHCAAHGDVVHGEAALDHHDHADHEEPTPDDLHVTDARRDSAHDDTHCELDPATQEELELPTGTVAGPLLPPSVAAEPSPPTRQTRATTARWAFAPKQSPPLG